METRRKFIPTASPTRPVQNPRSTSGNLEGEPEETTGPGSKGRTSPKLHRNRRKKWYRKLAHRYYLVHLLAKDRNFRWFLLAVMALGVVYVAFFGKIWTVTTPLVTQKLRLRTTDLIQTWRIKRTARRAAENGDLETSVRSYLMAVQINPFDLEGNREMIRAVSRSPVYKAPWVYSAANQLETVLKLSRTNEADLKLAAGLYSRYNLFDLAFSKFSDTKNQTSTEALLLLYRIYFLTEQYDKMDDLWAKNTSVLNQIPEAVLYRLSFMARFGNSEETETAVVKLRSISEEVGNPRRVQALRLLVQLDSVNGDLGRVRKGITTLEDNHAAEFEDHLYLIKALDSAGFTAEARKEMRNLPRRAESVIAAHLQLQIWSQLRDASAVVEFVHRELPEFRYDSRLVLNCASLLVMAEQWEEIRGLAIVVRQLPFLREILGDYDLYLSGLAEWGIGNRTAAEKFFRSSVDKPPSYIPALLQQATNYCAMNFPQMALRLFEGTSPDFGNSVSAWNELETIALKAKSTRLLELAVNNLYRLRPNDIRNANNYVAMLLLHRNRASDAIAITLPLMNEFPNLFGPRLNHAIALVQLGRASDAEKLLSGVDPELLPPNERSSWYFGLVLCYADEGKMEEAKWANSRVEREKLFPEQVIWLNEVLDGLSKPPK